jgi:O-antigen/teichoic acid export membrane protein
VNHVPVRANRLHRGVAKARQQTFTWGFASQAACSATNFGLSLLAGRALGPAGLGAVFVGFTFYQAVLGFQRSLLTDPLVSVSSALDPEARDQATRSALTVLWLWSCMATLLLVVGSLLLPAPASDGLLLFLPWLIPAMIQDFWRVVLFRENRGGAGALNDALWLAIMVITAPLVLAFESPWAVMACWGLGALTGMVLGFCQTRLLPETLTSAVRWWRSQAWPLGRWLGAGGIVYSLGAQGLIFLLAFILDARALGGFRAVESIFAPLSLLGPALALPGLPAVSRRVSSSINEARRLSIRLGAAAVLLTGAYFAITAMNHERLLAMVFGASFEGFGNLVWPIGLKQLLIAPTIGFNILLLAQKRGKALLLSQLIAALSMLSFSPWLAGMYGAVGAAWGNALAAGLQAVMITVCALAWSGSMGLEEAGTRPRRDDGSQPNHQAAL